MGFFGKNSYLIEIGYFYIIENEFNEEIVKNIKIKENESLTIGRGKDCSIKTPDDSEWGFIEEVHGQLFLQGGFLIEHLWYKDTSDFGSTFFTHSSRDFQLDITHLRNKAANIGDSSWIWIIRKVNGLSTGIVIMPKVISKA